MKFDYSLYLVTDSDMTKNLGLENVISAAIKNGVTCVQLREKKSSTKEFIEVARLIKKKLTNFKIPLFINDRVDIAQAVNADGVHLGQSDMPFSTAKKLLGNKFKIGVTIETVADFKRIKDESIDYFGVSSIFPTTSKMNIENIWKNKDLLQLETDIPLIGIGGINVSNVHLVLEKGLQGIAVISAICEQPSLKKVAEVTQVLSNKIENYHASK